MSSLNKDLRLAQRSLYNVISNVFEEKFERKIVGSNIIEIQMIYNVFYPTDKIISVTRIIENVIVNRFKI
jgi:hypothetical protein